MKRMTIEEVYNLINDCAINPNVKLDDIRVIFEDVLELCGFDMVFVMTNREYKYQLRYLLNCKSPSCKFTDYGEVAMRMADYGMLVNYYNEHEFYIHQVTENDCGCEGTIIQHAIMRDDEYYGTVGFVSAGNEEWNQEERELLRRLSQLLLIFIGLNRLKDRRNRLTGEEEKLIKNNTLEFFHVDLESGRCHALKIAPDMKKWCDEWGDYEQLFESHINTYVNKAYAKRLNATLELNKLKNTVSTETSTVVVEFPIDFNGKFRWIRATAELAECTENNEPRTMLLYFDDITEYERRSFIRRQLESAEYERCPVIIGVDLETEQYAIYVNDISHKIPIDTVGNYSSLRDLIESNASENYYRECFSSIFDLNRLKAHFEMNDDIVGMDYPFNFNGVTIWTRVEAAIATEASMHGSMVVLYFTDITAKRDEEKRLQEINNTLEKERERVLQAELRAMIDPLTGAYNRAGFEYSVEQYKDGITPTGFVIIDIDNFKVINDTYGHGFGDEVLAMVGERLDSSFRNEDKVFRLGGDEFALLLHRCHSDAWRSLQLKFASIHQYLRESIDKDITVTLSAGFSQNENGYIDEMFALADEALYHTKSVGRAGLSQINNDHEIIMEWHDSDLVDRRSADHKQVALGNWRVEIPTDASQAKGRLFLDETAHLMLSIPNVITPEECCEIWSNRLVERHRELCKEMVVKACSLGRVEGVYHWNHPTKGEIAIRVAGRGHDDGSTIELYGFMRELRESEVVLSYDDDTFLMKALNRIFHCVYYFNLKDKEYYIVKGHEDEPDVKLCHYNIDETLRKFVDDCVHPDYKKLVTEFTDLNTLGERLEGNFKIECEYLTITSLGWCHSRIMPVKWDDDGNITHAMIMSWSVDAEKKEELDREATTRKAMELQLRACELISKTAVLQTGLIDANTGDVEIWTDAIHSSKSLTCTFNEMKEWGIKYVYPQDLEYYNSTFTLSNIIAQIKSTGISELAHRRVGRNGEVITISYRFCMMYEDKILMVIEDVTNNIPKGVEWMNQFEILEEVKENIAIFDYDTYDIVYMNRMTRELLGMDSKQLRGKKCYEIFGDEGKPCSFCDKIILENGNSAFMCREVKGTGEDYLLHGCCMTINDKKYRVEQGFSLSAIKSSPDMNIASVIDEKMTSNDSLEALFNNVPGGLVMFRWDGKELKTLRISKYYAELYGSSLVSKDTNEGGPDFKRIHPDDVEDYKKAVMHALEETHQLDYTYRIWSEGANRYTWTKINAVSIPQPDGTAYIYAMYSDVTEQKDAELELQKGKTALLTALKISNKAK